MLIGAIIILIFAIITIIVRILYHFTKNSNSRFAHAIYRAWDEFFEPPYYAMVGYCILFLIVVIIGFMFK